MQENKNLSLLWEAFRKTRKECIFMKKKNLIVIIVAIILLIVIILWTKGFIPKQIAKIYGSAYMKINFPKMGLEYVNIEWSKYHGDYIITFKDKENQNYGCVIGPKYFPVSLGQGIFAIKEKYNEKYSSNNTESYIPDNSPNVADKNDIIVYVGKYIDIYSDEFEINI